MTLGQVALVVAAYLAGSMPWGYWIVRVVKHDDVRLYGSHNTGAANVWRTYGPRLGLPTVVLDLLKGFVPAFVGLTVFGPGTAILAGAAALIGHSYPIFLGLSGGKGVATGTGVMWAVCPICGVVALVVWFVMLWTFRYSSLASLSGAMAFVVMSIAMREPWPVILFSVLGGAMVVYRHRANIARLRAGTELRTVSFGRGGARMGRPPTT